MKCRHQRNMTEKKRCPVAHISHIKCPNVRSPPVNALCICPHSSPPLRLPYICCRKHTKQLSLLCHDISTGTGLSRQHIFPGPDSRIQERSAMPICSEAASCFCGKSMLSEWKHCKIVKKIHQIFLFFTIARFFLVPVKKIYLFLASVNEN